MQPDVQILLAPQAVRKNKCSLLPEGTDVTAHLAAHSSKITFCLPMYYYAWVLHLKIKTVK